MATTWLAARTSTSIAISNAGRSIDCTSNVFSNNAQSEHAITGKVYVEFLLDTVDINIGVGSVGSGYDPETYVGQAGSAAFDPLNGGTNDLSINGNFFTSGLATVCVAGDRVCVAFDETNDKVYWRVNGGSWHNSGNPTAGTGGSSYTFPATTYIAAQIGVTGSSLTLYSASEDWAYQPPSGFGEINSTPAALNPSDVDGTPTLSNSNRTIASGTDGTVHASRTNGGSTTPFYFEMLVGTSNTNNLAFVTNGTQALSTLSDVDPNDGIIVTGDGYWYSDNVTAYDQFSTTAGSNGDRVCVAVDPVNSKVWARLNNGTWNNSGTDNPATNTGGKNIADFGSKLYAGASSRFSYITTTVYFAVGDWAYDAPAGFGQLEEEPPVSYAPPFQTDAFGFNNPSAGGAAENVNVTGVGATGSVGTATASGKANSTITAAASATGSVGTATATGRANTTITAAASATGSVGTATGSGKANTTITAAASATGAVGSAVGSGKANTDVTGLSATGEVGTATAGVITSVPVTGVAATGQVGSATATGVANTTITAAASATGQVGSATGSGKATATITAAASATGNVGTATATGKATATVTGLSATGSVGTVTVDVPATTVNVTGLSATGQVGTATATGKATTTVTGLSATGSVGTATFSSVANVTVTGLGATGSVGSATGATPENILVTGVEATGLVGEVTTSGRASTTLTGLAATGAVGSVAIALPSSVTATGLSATGAVGTTTFKATVNADVTGLQAYCLFSAAIVWGKVEPNQAPGWSIVTPAQSPNWTEIVPSQDPNWNG